MCYHMIPPSGHTEYKYSTAKSSVPSYVSSLTRGSRRGTSFPPADVRTFEVPHYFNFISSTKQFGTFVILVVGNLYMLTVHTLLFGKLTNHLVTCTFDDGIVNCASQFPRS